MERVWLQLRTPPTPSLDRRKYVQDVYEHVLEGVDLHSLIDCIERCGRLPASVPNQTLPVLSDRRSDERGEKRDSGPILALRSSVVVGM